MTRYDELQEQARIAGYLVARYSPGDGISRYRFFRLDEVDETKQTYFGPADGCYTALGLAEAYQFLAHAIATQ